MSVIQCHYFLPSYSNKNVVNKSTCLYMQIKNEVSCSIIKALGVFILTSRIILTKSLFTLLQCRPIPIRKLSGLMSLWMKFLVWTNSILLIICGRNKTEKIKSTFLTRTRSTNHTVHRSWPISIFLIFHLSWNRTTTFSTFPQVDMIIMSMI